MPCSQWLAQAVAGFAERPNRFGFFTPLSELGEKRFSSPFSDTGMCPTVMKQWPSKAIPSSVRSLRPAGQGFHQWPRGAGDALRASGAQGPKAAAKSAPTRGEATGTLGSQRPDTPKSWLPRVRNKGHRCLTCQVVLLAHRLSLLCVPGEVSAPNTPSSPSS